MKISIITVTYNSQRTVADTLASVASQSYPSIEHLVIDGSSHDNTLAIVNRFPHVARVVSEPDAGIYDAMNKGLRLVTGEIVGILNSDDIYNNDQVIADVMKCFEDNNVDVVYGDLQYVRSDNLQKVVRTWRSGNYSRNKFHFGWMPPHPSLFVRKRVYQQVGFFNTQLRSAADYEMILRIMLKNECTAAYLPKVLVRMRTGGVSNASVKNRLRANREDRMAWKQNGLRPYFFTTTLKPFRKIFQYILR
jgi:glycosyltransferase involved in cell wall biosynthesis